MLLFLAGSAGAATVADGRDRLFNNGDFSYGGLLAANDLFAAALADAPDDPEGNLFYSVTRLAAFALHSGNGPGLATLRDLYEAFGFVRGPLDDVTAPPVNPPPLVDGVPAPDVLLPDGAAVQAFIAQHFIPEITAALANLAWVPADFLLEIEPGELGESRGVEVDRGDVLAYRAALLGLRALLRVMTAVDLDADLQRLLDLSAPGVLEIQRDLLDAYPSLLALVDTGPGEGAAALAAARQDLLDAVGAARAAFDHIAAEPVNGLYGELFFFESDEDRDEFEVELRRLERLAAAVRDNTVFVLEDTEQVWLLTDVTGGVAGDQARLYLDFEDGEPDADGEAFGPPDCDFLFCSGWVEDLSIGGAAADQVTVTLRTHCWNGDYRVILEATLADFDAARGVYTRMASGTFTYEDLGCGINKPPGSFSGELLEFQRHVERFDVNRLLGHPDGTPPADPRAFVPRFDRFNEILPDSFPTPGGQALAGVLPDFTTNDALTREMDLQPSGQHTVHHVPDGGGWLDLPPGQWPAAARVFSDPPGDADSEVAGMDLDTCYLLRDDQYLYLGLTLHDGGPPAVPLAGYRIDPRTWHSDPQPGSQMLGVRCEPLPGAPDQCAWQPVLGRRGAWAGAPPAAMQFYDAAHARAGDGCIAWRFPLADLDPLSGRFVWAGTFPGDSAPPADDNPTRILLDTAAVSGTVAVPGWDGQGIVVVAAWDGPDPQSSRFLGSTVLVDGPGAFTLDGLPAGGTVYLEARWDHDRDSLPSVGDPVTPAPVAVAVPPEGASDVRIVADATLRAQADDPFFVFCNVMARHTAGGKETTLYTQLIDPDGSVPFTVADLRVTGPAGFAYVFDETDYDGGNTYWRTLDGTPLSGEYRFAAVDEAGRRAEGFFHLDVRTPIPLPDPTTFQACRVVGAPLALSWSAVAWQGGDPFYRARIYDAQGDILWTSGLSPDTYAVVPDDVDVADPSCTWRVEVLDNRSFITSSNRTNSKRIALGSAAPPAPFPMAAAVFVRHDADGRHTVLEVDLGDPAGLLPDGIDSLEVFGPDGALIHAYDLRDVGAGGDYEPGGSGIFDAYEHGYFYHRAADQVLSDGIYTFVLTVTRDETPHVVETHDLLRAAPDIPPVDETSMQAVGAAPDDLTLSWTPPPAPTSPWCRVQIREATGLAIVHGSTRVLESAHAVPAGLLAGGTAYQWRVRCADNPRWGHFNLRSRTGWVDLEPTAAGRPFFTAAHVFHLVDGNGHGTAVDCMVSGADGTPPATAPAVSVQAPEGGPLMALTPDHYDAAAGEFWAVLPGRPVSGTYTFVLDGQAVSHDYLAAAAAMPRVDPATMAVHGDPLAPTVSWSGVSGFPGSVHYRLRVYSAAGRAVYRSSRQPLTAHAIPPGVLAPDRSYTFRVEANDASSWILYNVRSNSVRRGLAHPAADLAQAIGALRLAAGLPPAGLPVSGDVDGDGRTGLPEAIVILQILGWLR